MFVSAIFAFLPNLWSQALGEKRCGASWEEWQLRRKITRFDGRSEKGGHPWNSGGKNSGLLSKGKSTKINRRNTGLSMDSEAQWLRGFYMNGMKHGYGVYKWANGSIYKEN